MTDSSAKQSSVAEPGAEIIPTVTGVGASVEPPRSTTDLAEAASAGVYREVEISTDDIDASDDVEIDIVSEESTADTVTSSSSSDTGSSESSEHTNTTGNNSSSLTANSATEMSGNSEFHSSRPSGSSTSSSSSRRQRNGLFGINIDLNFDPSWLVPSNVAGRSISSLSVLPDWVRRPVEIIPNRGADNSNSTLSESARQGSQNYFHNQHGSSSSAGPASRIPGHSHQPAGDSSWNSSFASSSSIPNMQHGVPLRTRHNVTSMRSVDEDLDADYNPVSMLDLSAGRDRGDSHSYVIDIDSMGGWAEDDGAATSQRHDAPEGTNSEANNVASVSVGTGSPGDNSNGNGGGARRSASDITLQQGAVGGDGNPPSMADAATAANERTRAAEILRDAPETRAFINEISRYTTIRPFIVINFLKGVFDHGTSILAFLALVVTFSHANSLVKKEVSKQRKRNLLYLTMIVINLAACVAFIYYIFNEMELYYALIFLPTGSDLTSFWSLMWAVGVTDYVAKFVTVLAKIFVVSLPGCVLPFQKRGKYYLFVEITSQLYRSFLPIHPWLFYLVYGYEGTARMFGLFLSGLYVCFKISDSIGRFKEWLKALEKLLSNVHYGTIPTAKQLDSAGTICPICHDNFTSPTRLACTHIFCEECVATWFDRERTCPMCRAKVVDDPTYRDGSTAQYVQLF